MSFTALEPSFVSRRVADFRSLFSPPAQGPDIAFLLRLLPTSFLPDRLAADASSALYTWSLVAVTENGLYKRNTLTSAVPLRVSLWRKDGQSSAVKLVLRDQDIHLDPERGRCAFSFTLQASAEPVQDDVYIAVEAQHPAVLDIVYGPFRFSGGGGGDAQDDTPRAQMHRWTRVGPDVVLVKEQWDLDICGKLWDSAVVLSDVLHRKRPAPPPPRRILDLSSGTGYLAQVLGRLYPSAQVITTDLDDSLPLLQHNTRLNGSDNVAVRRLRWGDAQEIADVQPVDWVLASDVVYEDMHLAALVDTLAACCAHTLWIAYKPRGLSLDQERDVFVHKLQQSFELVETLCPDALDFGVTVARVVASIPAPPSADATADQQVDNEDAVLFAVGTLGVGANAANELHIVQYDEEHKQVAHVAYTHQHEVWAIAPCPVNQRLIATSYSTVSSTSRTIKSTLWRMSPEMQNIPKHAGAMGLPLEAVFTLDTTAAHTSWQKVLWDASLDSSDTVTKLVAVDQAALYVFSVTEALTDAVLGSTIPIKTEGGSARVLDAKWNPHSSTQVGVTHGTTFEMYDLRSNKVCASLANAHAVATRSFDFNHNKPYQIATGGEDCAIRVWDVRGGTDAATTPTNGTAAGSAPLLEFPREHSHWVTALAYNPFHDQLLLSGSSDSQLHLLSAASVSSAPVYAHSTDDELESTVPSPPQSQAAAGLKDGLVASYDQHEDSVYSVAWSATDPWVFASLDYGGRLLVNTVPKETKYKILL
ncbi:Serine/threonine-protein kinase [Sorochytrium milnesiophthora]